MLRLLVADVEVVLWSFAAVSADTTAMVGAMDRLARVRSTSGPATELMTTVECWYSAASVRHRGYELVNASAGRKVSEALKRWGAGRAEMSAPVAAAMFYCCQHLWRIHLCRQLTCWVNSTISAGLPAASCHRNTTLGALAEISGKFAAALFWS